MTNEKTPLDKLIEYAETAMADGYPYEVIGEDLALTVKALRALRVEPAAPQLLTAHEAALGMLERYIADPAHPPGFKYRYTVKGWEHWQQVNRT